MTSTTASIALEDPRTINEFFSDDGYFSIVVLDASDKFILDCYMDAEYAYSVAYFDKTQTQVENIALGMVTCFKGSNA